MTSHFGTRAIGTRRKLDRMRADNSKQKEGESWEIEQAWVLEEHEVQEADAVRGAGECFCG